jgi:hypothetical protein
VISGSNAALPTGNVALIASNASSVMKMRTITTSGRRPERAHAN